MDLQELIDRAEINDLLARYARAVDRCDWDLVRSCYHADAHDDHGLYEGDVDGLLVFLEQLAGQLISTTHQLGNQLIALAGDEARVETSCLGWYRRLDRNGAERSVAQGLRYLDHLDRRDDGWAIARRVVVLDWEHVLELGRSHATAASWTRGARGPSDPSHDHLATLDERFRLSATHREAHSAGPSS